MIRPFFSTMGAFAIVISAAAVFLPGCSDECEKQRETCIDWDTANECPIDAEAESLIRKANPSFDVVSVGLKGSLDNACCYYVMVRETGDACDIDFDPTPGF